jgi:hypothetical protein
MIYLVGPVVNKKMSNLKLSNGNVLLIFVKYPRLGRVKRRLSKTIGRENATFLYKIFVEKTIKETKSKNYERIIFFTPIRRKKEFIKWLGKRLKFIPQKGKNLGDRLYNAFKEAFALGAEKIVAIGTDSPLLNKEVIYRAFKKLNNKECVIGPSLDGGYYLLGLSCLNRGLFKGINWGTEKVFRQTLNAIKKINFRLGLLEKMLDVDDIKDLITLIRKSGRLY